MGMSDLNERLNHLEQGALNFLFPRRCPFCNQSSPFTPRSWTKLDKIISILQK